MTLIVIWSAEDVKMLVSAALWLRFYINDCTLPRGVVYFQPTYVTLNTEGRSAQFCIQISKFKKKRSTAMYSLLASLLILESVSVCIPFFSIVTFNYTISNKERCIKLQEGWEELIGISSCLMRWQAHSEGWVFSHQQYNSYLGLFRWRSLGL